MKTEPVKVTEAKKPAEASTDPVKAPSGSTGKGKEDSEAKSKPEEAK